MDDPFHAKIDDDPFHVKIDDPQTRTFSAQVHTQLLGKPAGTKTGNFIQ